MEKSVNEEQLKDEAQKFVSLLEPLKARARVVALHGDLGSGKTKFVQLIARALGVTEHVTSPTFIIEKIYPLGTRGSKWERLVHIDAYRLESAQELKALRWDELVSDPTNLILIEWGEKVTELLPHDTQHVYFTFVDETTRTIFYSHGEET